MAAQVRSGDQARQIVQWAKFHPRGLRGYNSLGVDGNYGLLTTRDYIQKANDETFVAIQIEHVEAVEDIERIAAVPDVDVLFIGPADLSQSMGIPGDWDHPQMWAAIDRVAQAARRHRKVWATLPKDAAWARRCVELGCRCLSLGLDTLTVHWGIEATKAQYADFFEKGKSPRPGSS
jgi:2-keto-3-deoxy-L-rhamnonate aldolase RhmA